METTELDFTQMILNNEALRSKAEEFLSKTIQQIVLNEFWEGTKVPSSFELAVTFNLHPRFPADKKRCFCTECCFYHFNQSIGDKFGIHSTCFLFTMLVDREYSDTIHKGISSLLENHFHISRERNQSSIFIVSLLNCSHFTRIFLPIEKKSIIYRMKSLSKKFGADDSYIDDMELMKVRKTLEATKRMEERK